MSSEARVAIFSDNDFNKANGVTTTLSALLAHAPPEVQPRIYTASAFSADHREFLSIRSIGIPEPLIDGPSTYLPPIRRFLAHAREDRINLVHVATHGVLGAAARYVAATLDLPSVGTVPAALANRASRLAASPARLGLLRTAISLAYGGCTSVLVPTDATRRLMLASGLAPHRVQLWPRGVDTQLYSPVARSLSLREVWGASEWCPALLYVGKVEANCGLGLLPRLAERLQRMGLAHRWVVVGEGAMLPDLKARMPDAVFTGLLSRVDLARTCASADVLVCPSRGATVGGIVLEAQASGLPVVMSAFATPHEHMVDGRTGVVCDGDDVDTWAGAIASVVGDRRRREDMTHAAVAYATTRTWRRALKPIYDAYLTSLGGTVPAVASAPPVVASPDRRAS